MKKAFTLAEVLITLGIVGVIAVLTIPSVMENYRNRLYTTQLQKVYSQIVNAVESIMNDEHADDFYETRAADINDTANSSSGSSYFLDNYFKSSKTFSGSDLSDAYSQVYESIDGDVTDFAAGIEECSRTKAGATICPYYDGEKQVFLFFVDVNGPDEPNVAGKDAFVLSVAPDGTVEDFDNKNCDSCNEKTSEYGHVGDYSSGCLQCIIDNNWKMNY